MSIKDRIGQWLWPHEWVLMIGWDLFFRCKKCRVEYHAALPLISRAFISGNIPIEGACKP